MDPQLDGLTKLYNRHYLQTLGKSLCEQAQTDSSRLGLIYVSVDKMSSVNNMIGFTGGDRLIVRFAEVIQSLLGNGAVAGRTGGDEFLAIVPVKSEEELEALAEAIREEAKTITVMGGHLGEVSSDPVTLTLGLSCFSRHGSELKSVWMAAEEAAIHGKNTGRDRIVWANTA